MLLFFVSSADQASGRRVSEQHTRYGRDKQARFVRLRFFADYIEPIDPID